MGVTRIEKLTPEQEAQLEPWADMWIKRGLCTDEAAWDDFERGCKACYGHADLIWHDNVIRVGNPLTLSRASVLAAVAMDEAYQKGKPHSHTPDFLDKLTELYFDRGYDKQVVEHAVAAIRGTYRDDAIGEELVYNDAVISKLRNTNLREKISQGWSNSIGGQFWLSWQAYESFFREVCELELPTNQRAADYALAQQSACWWWPHTHFVMVSDRPKEIHREQIAPRGWGSHRLHCTTGPAISWRDGWGLWFVNGVNMEQRHVEQPETITVEEIREEGNAERRRILMELFGVGRYLTESGAKLIDSDGGLAGVGGAPRALLEDDTQQRWLVGTDGSTKRVYHMPVPAEANTCSQAHSMIAGFDESLIVAEC